MNKSEQKTYQAARKEGYGAAESLRIAKTQEVFHNLEYQGLVRLRAEPEEENYFDVYGEPTGYEGANGRRVSAEQERKETYDLINLHGCWCIFSEWRGSEESDWERADSVGMCAGYKNVLSPIENRYVVDLMRAAIDEVEKFQDEKAWEEKSEKEYEATQEAFWREFSVEQDIFGDEI